MDETRRNLGRGFSALAFFMAAILGVVGAEPPAHAQCGGLCLYEVGTPDQARSAAGAGARADDASTAYWNPAGMTRLEGTHLTLGTTLGFTSLEFNTSSKTDVAGNSGGSLDTFLPLGAAYLATNPFDKLRVGFVFNGLYGGAANYDNGWVGREYVTNVNLVGLNLQPAVAYPITDWLSVGGGVSIVYMRYDEQFRTDPSPFAPTVEIKKADDWSVAGTVGVLLTPLGNETRFGLYYRTQTDINLSGHLDNPTPMDVKFNGNFDLPQGFNGSVFHQLTPEWALLGDAGWSDWSAFSSQTFTFGADTTPIERNWKDTWRLGVGAMYRPRERLGFQGGFSYDSSPVSASNRTPDIPVGEGYRFSIGGSYLPADNIVLDVAYTLMWMGDMNVDNVPLPSQSTTVLDGDYDPAFIHFVGMTLGVKF